MVTLLESREKSPGVRFMHPRERDGDATVIFSGKAFLENRDYLIEQNIAFARNMGWSEEEARSFMPRELSVDALTGGRLLTPDLTDIIMEDSRKALQVPSTILLRKEAAAPGDYFALSSGRMFFIQTGEGEMPVFFHILRSIDSRYRGKHRGRAFVELHLVTHSQAEAYIHRSANPMALVTNTRLVSLALESNHPITSNFTKGSIEHNVTQKVLDLTTEGDYELGLDGVVRGLYSHHPSLRSG